MKSELCHVEENCEWRKHYGDLRPENKYILVGLLLIIKTYVWYQPNCVQFCESKTTFYHSSDRYM